jgi:hypothetical protein
MKNSIIYIFIAVTLFIFGCTNNSNETEHGHHLQDSTGQAKPENLESYTIGFQNIVKSSNGVFRGVSFGMSIPEVKKVEEKTQLQEEQNNQLDYMVDFAELEEAEVNYFFNEYNRVNSIEVNIYPKSKGSQDTIFSEFERYFQNRYGKATKNEELVKNWEYKGDNIFILMEKKDTDKVHDINIRFSSLTKEMASALFEADSSKGQ